jgi:hypothetical protein
MLLIDGVFRGTWRIARQHQAAVLHVEPFGPVPRRERDAIAFEGERLLRFAVEDAETVDVHFDA